MRRGQKVPLLNGAYDAQSVIASAQRCVNLYLEHNPGDSPFPTTHYLTPGLTLLGALAAANGGWRCLYPTSTGLLLGICGSNLCLISGTPSAVTVKVLAQLGTQSGPASINDNGVTALACDGSPVGVWVNLATQVATTVVDEAFYGSSRVDVVDGYFVLNRPQTSQFYISLYQQAAFDATDFAAKNGYSDPLVASIVSRRNIWLFGTQTAEVWYNTGAADFTFARIDGIFVQHGCAAVGSLAQADGAVFFVSTDPQGNAMVMRTAGFEAQKISTFALDFALQQYETIADAIGYTYQRAGHVFYVLSFPTADATWVYDMASGQWHEWVSIDGNGVEHRHQCAVMAFWQGVHIGGDWSNGNLYLLDPLSAMENGKPIVRRRGFPHMIDGGNRVIYRQFVADFEVGAAQSTYQTNDTAVYLRWSDTKGKTWGNPIAGDLGPLGDYLRSMQFTRLGVARDRVFELFWSAPQITALNGGFVVADPVNN